MQAPHAPSPQATLVPVSRSRSRRKRDKGRRASRPCRTRRMPLRVKTTNLRKQSANSKGNGALYTVQGVLSNAVRVNLSSRQHRPSRRRSFSLIPEKKRLFDNQVKQVAYSNHQNYTPESQEQSLCTTQRETKAIRIHETK